MIDMTKVGDWGPTPKSAPTGGGANAPLNGGMLGSGVVTTIPGNLTGSVTSGGTTGWNGYGTPPPNTGGYQMPGESTGYGMDGMGFLFPSEWGQAGDYYSGILSGTGAGVGGGGGGRINTPSAWTTGLESLTPMSQTGMPTSSDAWWNATQDVTNRSINEAIANAAEQAGLGGMRWSTPLGYTAQDISGKYMGEATQQWADRQMAAEEAARQRMLEATGQLYQYGQGQYQMDKDAAARRAAAGARGTAQMNQAAQMLMGLGGQKAGLGLDVISKMFGMGGSMQDAQQQAINASYNNPYMNMAQGYLQAQNPVPQTYQPGAGSQIAGAFGAMMPYAYDYYNQNKNGGYQQYPVPNTQFYT